MLFILLVLQYMSFKKGGITQKWHLPPPHTHLVGVMRVCTACSSGDFEGSTTKYYLSPLPQITFCRNLTFLTRHVL